MKDILFRVFIVLFIFFGVGLIIEAYTEPAPVVVNNMPNTDVCYTYKNTMECFQSFGELNDD